MSADSDFARYARPEFARLFRALHLDVTYRAGRGDHLTLGRPDGEEGSGAGDQVLDLVGGAGASLFGHNHPALVEVARRCLDEEVPFNTQGSFRPGAAELARLLSDTVGATTGARYVVTLGNTGADAVEAAVKHATVERRRRLGALQEEFELTLRRVR
ncbi:aminotransferase class III-fold pyridoxal phosphate-dependent enzyme, partial [Streptomyces sp. TRM76130]|nr:aminotransferase class III-fold pyridoxal phosphate-dependent enzyme [Streptomyces sp. TRM76130]